VQHQRDFTLFHRRRAALYLAPGERDPSTAAAISATATTTVPAAPTVVFATWRSSRRGPRQHVGDLDPRRLSRSVGGVPLSFQLTLLLLQRGQLLGLIGAAARGGPSFFGHPGGPLCLACLDLRVHGGLAVFELLQGLARAQHRGLELGLPRVLRSLAYTGSNPT